ncbi:hypothetical protein JXA32_09750 [Candidatus Sumerlaeota bacterium]|nr:hypothetical protein [Candidatus Sumerlaeota bacterium]
MNEAQTKRPMRWLAAALIAAMAAVWPWTHATAATGMTQVTQFRTTAEIGGMTFEGRAFVLKPGQEAHLMAVKETDEGASLTAEGLTFNPITIDKPESIQLSVLTKTHWQVQTGKITALGERELKWVAPDRPGNYEIELTQTHTQGFENLSMSLQSKLPATTNERAIARYTMLVMQQFDRDGNGLIGGFPIGVYPNEDGENVKPYIAARREKYHPPKWFICVTPEVSNQKISPHFRLGQFVTEWESNRPDTYIALDMRLLERLEEIVVELNKAGHKVETLKIFRGYMSPNLVQRFRRRGGEFTDFTRQMYGDGAAFIVDADNDGKMDDLNKDDKIDKADAEYVEQICTRLERASGKYGGVGVYSGRTDPTTPETPWVEVDMRGNRERW